MTNRERCWLAGLQLYTEGKNPARNSIFITAENCLLLFSLYRYPIILVNILSNSFVRHALNHLKTVFPDLILRDQKCFDTKEGYEELLKAVPDSRIVETLRTKWEADPSRSSEDKWLDLLSYKTSKVFFLFLLQHLQFTILITFERV